jgi:hypothetical protein
MKSKNIVVKCLTAIHAERERESERERVRVPAKAKGGGKKRKKDEREEEGEAEERLGPLGDGGCRPVRTMGKLLSRLTLADVLKDEANAWLRRPLSERVVALFFPLQGVEKPAPAEQPCGEVGAKIATAFLRPAVREALAIFATHRLSLPPSLADAVATDDPASPLPLSLLSLSLPIHLEYFGYPMRKTAPVRDALSNDMYIEYLAKNGQALACWLVVATWLATQSALGRWLAAVRTEVRTQAAAEAAGELSRGGSSSSSSAGGGAADLRAATNVAQLLAEARRAHLSVRLVCAVTAAAAERLDDHLFLLALFGLPAPGTNAATLNPPPLLTDDYLLFVEVFGDSLPEGGVMSINLAAGGGPVRRSPNWAGALALDLSCGRLQDVSGVYAADARYLRVASMVKLASTLFHHEPHEGAAGCEERARVRADAISMPMPSRLGDFKYHPLYCLERFVTSQEAIHPREPLGYTGKGEKAEPVYARSALARLLTDDKWLIEGMQVKAGEEPLKYLGKRPVRAAGGRDDTASAAGVAAVVGGAVAGRAVAARDGRGEREGERERERNEPPAAAADEVDPHSMPLYGPWQVEPYKPPEISEDGLIPRNRYGNVYLFQPSFLPPHTIHFPALSEAAARKLGLDAVPAMTGWQFVKMRYLPRIEGVIVGEWEEERILRFFADKEAEGERERRGRARDLWATLTAKLRLARDVLAA